MRAFVVLEVSGGGELLATVLLLADEGLVSVVGPHVDLESLQHVEALPTALRSTAKRTIISDKIHTERPECFCVLR